MNQWKKLSISAKIFQVFNFAFLTLFAFTTIYPLWSTVVQSLSQSGIGRFYDLVIGKFTLFAYEFILTDKEIWTAYGVSIYRTVAGTFLSVLVTALYAYPLSRKGMPLKGFFTVYMVITMLFTGGMIPLYLVIQKMHLLNNLLVYLIPGMMSTYNAIILRNFFASLPSALIESALIDGASEKKIFFSIILPLSKPALATVALWSAVSHWNAWFDSMLYFTGTKFQTIQLYLQRMVSENARTDGIISGLDVDNSVECIQSATIVLVVLPMLIVYPFIQKYFVTGITLGSVKE